MTVASGIAQFVAGKSFENIPRDVWGTVKNCFLDYIGVSAAGSTDAIGKTILAWVNGMRDGTQAVIINGPRRSMLTAALANGVFGHALDFDDISTSQLGHPSGAIIPAILALGENRGLSGKEIMTAYVLGLEVCCKAGVVMNPDLASTGWHTTGVLGTFGATVASGKLLHLSIEQLTNALGIACSEAAGLKVNVGTMTKSFHAGKAAQNGLLAALLAEKGFTGSKEAFEGTNGFGRVFSPKSEPRKIVELLGSPWDITEPGITFKRYPSCGATHPALDAIFFLIQKHAVKAQDVASVDCLTTPFTQNVLIYPEAKSGIEGKFSLQFCLALALLEGTAGIHQFTDAKANESAMRDLMKKIHLIVDPELAAAGYAPSQGVAACKVEITLKDGRRFSNTVNEAKGSKKNPMSDAEMEEKFLSCCQGIFNKRKTEGIIAAIRDLDNAADIRQLTGLLGARR